MLFLVRDSSPCAGFVTGRMELLLETSITHAKDGLTAGNLHSDAKAMSQDSWTAQCVWIVQPFEVQISEVMRLNLYFPAVTPIPVRQVHLSGNAGVTLLPRNATLVWSCGTGLQAQGRGRSGTPCSHNWGYLQVWHSSKFCPVPFWAGEVYRLLFSRCSRATAGKHSQKFHPWIWHPWGKWCSAHEPWGHHTALSSFTAPKHCQCHNPALGVCPWQSCLTWCCNTPSSKPEQTLSASCSGPERKHENHRYDNCFSSTQVKREKIIGFLVFKLCFGLVFKLGLIEF